MGWRRRWVREWLVVTSSRSYQVVLLLITARNTLSTPERMWKMWRKEFIATIKVHKICIWNNCFFSAKNWRIKSKETNKQKQSKHIHEFLGLFISWNHIVKLGWCARLWEELSRNGWKTQREREQETSVFNYERRTSLGTGFGLQIRNMC